MSSPIFMFEGLDYSGKSTVAQSILEKLNARHVPVILVRAPGQTHTGQILRSMAVDQKIKIPGMVDPGMPTPIHDSLTRSLLHMADMRETLHQIVEPAMVEGKVIVCDRWHNSTRAYGPAHGADPRQIDALVHTVVPAIMRLNATVLYLHIPVEVMLERRQRIGQRNVADNLTTNFYSRVAAAYERLWHHHTDYSETWHRIDAVVSLEKVTEVVWRLICGQLNII